MICLELPAVLAERLRALGVDPEVFILELLVRELNLDPADEAKARVELATKLLEEGKSIVDKDPIQASEKLYKAAEECVKALAIHFQLSDILSKVRERGRWTVTELEKAVEKISRIVGEWFRRAWDTAWALHVWGFHEAKLDSEAVRMRLPDIEEIVRKAEELILLTKQE